MGRVKHCRLSMTGIWTQETMAPSPANSSSSTKLNSCRENPSAEPDGYMSPNPVPTVPLVLYGFSFSVFFFFCLIPFSFLFLFLFCFSFINPFLIFFASYIFHSMAVYKPSLTLGTSGWRTPASTSGPTPTTSSLFILKPSSRRSALRIQMVHSNPWIRWNIVLT